jgi:alkanesulfonate monooxygenase SsuD/methylene tetrahydromethanopterin reductase-like flavin-dependent oxidoreductase (luciferase family)
MTIDRGFGVSALISADFIQPLAQAAEAEGYTTFWVNDVPGGNGLEQLARAQVVTSRIRLGAGVLPVDRWTPSDIVREVERLRLDPERVAIGIGSGGITSGALDATSAASHALTASGLGRVLVGALGMAMCELAGRDADGVILNWLVPEAAPALIERVRAGAQSVGKPEPEIVAYVRTACHPAADEVLQREAAAYESYPAYRRHFERMNVRAIDTTINGGSDAISERFQCFAPGVDEVVARAIAQDDSIAGYLAVLSAASPDGG